MRRFKHLDTLIIIFVVVLMISNLVAQKIVAIGPHFRLSGAQLLFPVTYIFGDIFTEVYGYAASRRAIWTGFLASALLAVMGNVIVALPEPVPVSVAVWSSLPRTDSLRERRLRMVCAVAADRKSTRLNSSHRT